MLSFCSRCCLLLSFCSLVLWRSLLFSFLLFCCPLCCFLLVSFVLFCSLSVCCYFLLYFTPSNLWFTIKLNSNHFVQFQFSPVQFNSMQFNSMQTLMRSHSMCSPVCIYTQPCVCIHAALYVYTHSVVRIYTQPCVYIGFKI